MPVLWRSRRAVIEGEGVEKARLCQITGKAGVWRIKRDMVKRLFFLVVWSLLLLGGVSGPTIAEDEVADGERILSFASHIQVQPDASLWVTESIVVRATGDQIKRGIVRDFPTIYTDRYGHKVKVGFRVLEVRRDGAPESFHVESVANGKKIYLGKKEVFLPSGEYVYTLKYRTTRQLGFFADFDELYWNVTGHGWTFSLDQVRAVVEPPSGAPVLQYAAYTGAMGARGQDFKVSTDPAGCLVFTATRGFASGEGLTVAVAWPKGYVQSPSWSSRARYFLEDNPAAILVWLTLMALCVYYLAVWHKVGRDPPKGLVIPLYEPPQGFSPAAVRYLKRMGFDDKAFAATLVNLAVKGGLVIEDQGGEVILRSRAKPAASLTGQEGKVLSRLFKGRNVLKLTDRNHATIGAALKALESSLEWELKKKHFITNSRYFAWGILLSFLALAGVVLMAGNRDIMMVTGFLVLWLSIWTPVSMSLWGAKDQRLMAGFFSFFAVLAIIITFFVSPLTAMVFVLLVFLNLLFYLLLKAYTLSGRRLMDQIDGFRMYLTAAEQQRLELLHPPERTPQLFENYLPYALALDVENEWCEQFAEILEEANYAPDWYRGVSWRSLGTGGLASSLGSSLSSTISSSSSPPGSSSGSGGGGSSGGGGGGGGGSGW